MPAVERPRALWGGSVGGIARPISEASHWRAQRKALSIRRRVGASGNALAGPFPPKPPKMRWVTYKRLQAVDAALQEQWLLGVSGGLGRFHGRVKRR